MTDSDTLKLDDVYWFGGNKEDFKMLQELDGFQPKKKQKNLLDFNEKEFISFAKKLGFNQSSEDYLSNVDVSDKIKKQEYPSKNVECKKSSEKNVSTVKENRKKKKKPRPIGSQQKIADEKEKVGLESNSKSKITNSFEKNALGDVPASSVLVNSGVWHEEFFTDDAKGSCSSLPASAVECLKEFAMKLLDNEVKLYKKKNNGGSEKDGKVNWMKTVSAAGTLSDRVAALSLQLHEAPLLNLDSLEALLAMTKKKGRREAFIGLEAIRDILLADLMPGNRKLKKFNQHPLDLLYSSLTSSEESMQWTRKECLCRLVFWAFEHRLKELVAQFVDQLKVFVSDTLEASKTKAMSVALNVLLNKPEQEESLLSLLVNKLGDPKYKIASKALHMLNRVVSQHPLMQGIVVEKVCNLLLRPNLSPRAQYYCVCFLSSQFLSHDRKEVAQKLVRIYMTIFKSCINKVASDNKILGALLTGVNRAFPYVDTSEESITGDIDVLFRAVHLTNLSTTVQSLVLLFQVFHSRNEVSDRFYNALYATLLHPELPVCTHRHPMFLNLLYRSLKTDPCESRIGAFIKRILQVSSWQPPTFCAAVMTMIHELCRARPSLSYQFFSSGLDTSEGDSNIKGKEETTWQEEENVNENSNASSWVHQHKEKMRKGVSSYNPIHRNPLYCGAEMTSVWELHTFTKHFHPTVSLYANNLLQFGGGGESHTGDPLEDYSLMKFLDKFVYRNPKSNQQSDKKRSELSKLVTSHRRKRHATFNNVVPVNSIEFLQKKNHSPEEIFFHRYFASRAGLKSRRKKSSDTGSDVESLSDHEFDHFMMSQEGQKQINSQLNFSDHIYKNKSAELDLMDVDSDKSDEDSDVSEISDHDEETGNYGFVMEDGEEDLFDDAGVFMSGDGSPQKSHSVGHKKLASKQRKSGAEKLGMMLEENEKFESGGSVAMSNKDRASFKQLRWEKKQQEKDIIQNKKRRWKRDNQDGKSRKENFSRNKMSRFGNKFSKRPRK